MLKRYKGNPILGPNPKNWWESRAVFNPAVCRKDGKIHLFPRAIGEDEDYVSRISHYVSDDGIHFEPAHHGPILGPGKLYDRYACEDPRITEIEGIYYFTCVVLSKPVHQNGALPATALFSTKDFRNFHRHGLITSRSSVNKDVMLFPEKINGKYVMLHRPSGWTKEWMDKKKPNKSKMKIPCSYEELPQKPAIWIAYSNNLKHWFGHKVVMESQYWWENCKIGGGAAPPIKTDLGWLIIYHGMEHGSYRAGAALLDLHNPWKVIGRTKEPILEPEEDYERIGDVNNVVFPEGNVVIGDELFVYYGAADRCVGLATISLNKLLKLFL